jgi:hypothetical protein
MDFEQFYRDMGDRPEGTTLERRCNDEPYSPNNCLWATKAAQARNRRTTRLITFKGETLCLKDWAARVGLKQETLTNRLNCGWPVEKALTEPVQVRRAV